MPMVFLYLFFNLACQDKKESFVQAMYDWLTPSFWSSEYLYKSAEMKVQKEMSLILKHLVRK